MVQRAENQHFVMVSLGKFMNDEKFVEVIYGFNREFVTLVEPFASFILHLLRVLMVR